VIYTVTITGHVPCKKNGKHSWKGRVVIDPAARSAADWLTLQLRSWWGSREPLEKVQRIEAVFNVRDGRSDLDGKYTTIQDCLVAAGVLANDSIARVPQFACGAFQGKGGESVTISILVEVEPPRQKRRVTP